MKLTCKQINHQNINRRDFLQIGGIGMLAMLGLGTTSLRHLQALLQASGLKLDLYHDLDPCDLLVSLNPGQQGRIINRSADVYALPSVDSASIKKYWHDTVLPITGITVGDSGDSINSVWYKISNEGYIHSIELQPVLTMTNPVIMNLPEGGVIAEVTVPFTDAHWDPGMDKPVAYRYYYATTYWAVETTIDDQGIPWYGVRDDKWDYMFYVPATHLRIIPPEELKPISPNVPIENKRIEVHLPVQVMIAYEYDQPVYMARVATGAILSNGDFSTPPGRYMTFHKRPSRHMARGNLAANGYDLPGVPWNSYITEEGIAFHGTYWHNAYGRPRSHGCINLTPKAARWVFLWTSPIVPYDQESLYEDYGTNVDIIG